MPLNAQVSVSLVAHETAAGDLSRAMRVTPATFAMLFTDGTAANQAQVAWSKSGTAGAAGTTDFTLGSLADTRDGAAVTVAFSAIKAVYVRNTATSGSLLLGGLSPGFAAFPASGTIAIAPGGVYCVVSPSESGFAAATARLAASAGTVAYEIAVIGEGTVT